jgi:Mycothiol maleylpyruvate isomerase N-terminal domain
VATKEELTSREQRAWDELSASIAAVPLADRESPWLNNGWSVKDVEWHIALWWKDCIRTLDSLAAGGYEEWNGDTDAANDAALREGRSMTVDEVEAGLASTRQRLLGSWGEAPDDPRALDYFVSETIEHYEEHAADLAKLAEG